MFTPLNLNLKCMYQNFFYFLSIFTTYLIQLFAFLKNVILRIHFFCFWVVQCLKTPSWADGSDQILIKVCSASDQFLHNPKNTFSFSLGISLSLSLYLYIFFNFLRYYNIEFVCTYVYITIDICCFYFLGLVIVGIWSLRMEWN